MGEEEDKGEGGEVGGSHIGERLGEELGGLCVALGLDDGRLLVELRLLHHEPGLLSVLLRHLLLLHRLGELPGGGASQTCHKRLQNCQT